MCFHGRIFVTGVQQTIWHTPYVALVYSYLMISGCVCGSHKLIGGNVQGGSLIFGWGGRGGTYPEYPHLDSVNKICIQ